VVRVAMRLFPNYFGSTCYCYVESVLCIMTISDCTRLGLRRAGDLLPFALSSDLVAQLL